MINDVVLCNKYEIPGSLAGLDWREKCIISPWMHRSQEVIDITASVRPREAEMVGGKRGNKREKDRIQT